MKAQYYIKNCIEDLVTEYNASCSIVKPGILAQLNGIERLLEYLGITLLIVEREGLITYTLTFDSTNK